MRPLKYLGTTTVCWKVSLRATAHFQHSSPGVASAGCNGARREKPEKLDHLSWPALRLSPRTYFIGGITLQSRFSRGIFAMQLPRYHPRDPSPQIAWQLQKLARAICWFNGWYWRWIHSYVTDSGVSGLALNQPALVLANHTNELDPGYVMMAFRRHVALLATESVFLDKKTGPIAHYFGAIPKKKFTTDTSAIRRLNAWAKAGACVGLFPEGERTWDGEFQPLVPGLDRLVALLNLPVVTIRILNADRVWPRWTAKPRRGRVHVEVNPAMRFDRKAKGADVLAAIEAGLRPRNNDHLSWRVHCPNFAAGIETALMLCPHCQQHGQMHSQDHVLSCDACGHAWRVDDLHVFHPLNSGSTGPFALRDAIAQACKHIHNERGVLAHLRGTPLVEEVGLVDLDAPVPVVTKVRARLHGDHLTFEGATPALPHTLALADLATMSVDLRSRLVLRTADRNFGLDFPDAKCAPAARLWLLLIQARGHATNLAETLGRTKSPAQTSPTEEPVLA